MSSRARPLLDLDPATVRRARSLARRAGKPVVDLARSHTTVSVERATLRLAGLAGADHENVPWVNHLVDAVRDGVGLEHGVTTPVWDALRRGEAPDLLTLAQKSASGAVTFRLPEGKDATAARKAARTSVGTRHPRRSTGSAPPATGWCRRYGDPKQKPWIYLIVATGDIYEDIPQAQQAAREGADVIAVIRSTGQSLLDFVPEGATREGYAGTYATQENFRLMRAALDESSRELGRYVRLTNYASGLCMPEIAALAGPRAARHDAQRLDVRHPLPRHQPDPHLRRPALQPPGARPRRHHHQHRRGQLPHHRGCRRGRAHGHREPAAQRVLRQGGRASRTGSSAWATPSRSTPRSPTASGSSSPTPCSPASSSRTPR